VVLKPFIAFLNVLYLTGFVEQYNGISISSVPRLEISFLFFNVSDISKNSAKVLELTFILSLGGLKLFIVDANNTINNGHLSNQTSNIRSISSGSDK
jgi:hypothetical protein